jgi:hypothetical protein
MVDQTQIPELPVRTVGQRQAAPDHRRNFGFQEIRQKVRASDNRKNFAEFW